MADKRRLMKRDPLGRRTDRVRTREREQILALATKDHLPPEEIAKCLKRDVRTIRKHLAVAGFIPGKLPLHLEGNIAKDSHYEWVRLAVRNRGTSAIGGCYGKLRRFRRIGSDGSTVPCEGLPTPGRNYPWQTKGGGCELKRTIAGRDVDYLDLMRSGTPGDRRLSTIEAQRDPHGQLRQAFVAPLEDGRYEAVIQVGSEQQAAPPIFAKAIISLGAATQIEVEMVSEEVLEDAT